MLGIRDVAKAMRDMFVTNGCVVESFQVNEEAGLIRGKVMCGNDTLYVHVGPDVPKVWDGVLSTKKERGAFAWGMRESWLHPQCVVAPKVLTDLPEGSVESAYNTICMEPLHYQGGFYFVKAIMLGVAALSASGVMGLL